MAMNVKFLKGSASNYAALATKDVNTFYYVDEKSLYLGSILLSNEVTAAQFNGLVDRVSALENAKFQDQINAINETLKSIATSATVEAIDERLKLVEGDYLKAADKTELEGKITAHETAVNTKFNDYSTTAQMNEAIKVVSDNLANNYSTKAVADTLYDAKNSAATAESNAKGYADGLIAAEVERANGAYDAKNAAATALQNAKDYVDGKFTTANLDQYTTEQEVKDIVDAVIKSVADSDTMDSLTELVDYIEAHGGEATEMAGAISALEAKVDVEKVSTAIATATADMATNASVDGKLTNYMTTAAHETFVSGNAALQSGITATKVGEYDATKKTVDDNASIWSAKQDALTEAQLAAVNSGVTTEVVGKANSAIQAADLAPYAKTTDIEGSLAKAESAVQPAAIADMATKTEVDSTYLKKADKYDDTAVVGRVEALEARFKGTNVEVADIVKAVNKLADGQDTTDDTLRTAQSDINSIVAQLTWGSF